MNHTCLYSPAAERHRTLASTHFFIPLRVEGGITYCSLSRYVHIWWKWGTVISELVYVRSVVGWSIKIGWDGVNEVVCALSGSTENARHETTAQSKMPQCRDGNCEKGNNGTKVQVWKLWGRNQWHQNAGVETAGNGNCGTMLQGVENATQASMDSQTNTSLSTNLVIFSVVFGSLHVDGLHV